jgi:glycosyltransferase involved in cell wall biosynthesis
MFADMLDKTRSTIVSLVSTKVSFITPSDFNMQALSELGFREDQIQIIPLFHRYSLAQMEHPHVHPRFLAYGRYALNKGIPELVRALADSESTATIFGDNHTVEENKVVYKEACSMNQANVQLMGPIDDFEHLFGLANIYICNSYHEGFNLPSVEAMAHSLPVLLRKGSAMDELITSGKEGFLYEDVAEIPGLARRILFNYRNFSHNAYRRSLEYTYENYRTRYLAALKKIKSY